MNTEFKLKETTIVEMTAMGSVVSLISNKGAEVADLEVVNYGNELSLSETKDVRARVKLSREQAKVLYDALGAWLFEPGQR